MVPSTVPSLLQILRSENSRTSLLAPTEEYSLNIWDTLGNLASWKLETTKIISFLNSFIRFGGPYVKQPDALDY